MTKRFLIAATIAAGSALGATPLAAAGVMDSFRFEFYAAAPDVHIGTDTYTHPNDFRHYGDYYLYPGFGDPQRHTSCVETRVRAEDGRTIGRITCFGREETTSVPLR